MSTITVTITLPTARTDNTPLALTDIASVVLSKSAGTGAAAVVDTVDAPFASGTVTFTDDSPDFGQTDNYSVVVTDIEGNASATGTASVAVPASQLAPPNAPTVAAVFNP